MRSELIRTRFFGLGEDRPAMVRQGLEAVMRGDHDLNPGMGIGDRLTPAAVLVPIVARPDGPTILLTQRTDHLPDHPGQISFPGGRIEPGDRDEVDAALRETEEEVGLARDHVEVLGRLDDYAVRTGYLVTPVVGLVSPPFELTPDPIEVAEIFEVPLGFLLNSANHSRGQRVYKGVAREFHVLTYEQRYIWGATAGMLINLYEILAQE